MTKTVQIVQKAGAIRLDAQVVAQARLGWAVYGSPFVLNGLPSQVMLYTGNIGVDPGYVSVLKDAERSMAVQVEEKLAQGWELYGQPYEFGGQAVQAMIRGDLSVINGDTNGGGSGYIPPATTARPQLVFVNGTTQYQLSEKDHGTHILFDGVQNVLLYLPVLEATAQTILVKVTNLYGTIEMNPQSSRFIGFGSTTLSQGTAELTGVRDIWIADGFLQ